ncbi:MAG: M48 family metalloprotease [Phycisphaerales bacterium]|nr:M48 family metalloprotease [Phycisphaerales bacterium]
MMHLHVVAAFALLLWWSREPPFTPWFNDSMTTWLVVLTLPIALWTCGQAFIRRARRGIRTGAHAIDRPVESLRRLPVVLRTLALAAFVAELTLTPWANLIGKSRLAAVPGLVDLVVVGPFLAAAVGVILCQYDVERLGRETTAGFLDHAVPHPVTWSRSAYLGFHIRHQLLSVVVPMMLILTAHDLTRRFERRIDRALPIPWAPDILLGIAAAVVFVIAPWLLKHIWTTHPLPRGPLRDDLERLCRTIGLKCRDILVWRSNGMVVNAAVMGVVTPVRYVVLTDALLDAMDPDQTRAVFGHEAGHIVHRHIPYFLLFAVISMLLASGAMELLFQSAWMADEPARGERLIVQAVGLITIAFVWGFGFGFVSRRFERQADLFGARCVSPADPALCRLPCGVHADPPPHASSDLLCATGAEIFAGALLRVARLNGIPVHEHSWRHASIARRVANLRRLAGDASQLRRFERTIRAIKIVLIIGSVGGLIVSAWYVAPYVVDVLRRRG